MSKDPPFGTAASLSFDFGAVSMAALPGQKREAPPPFSPRLSADVSLDSPSIGVAVRSGGPGDLGWDTWVLR